MAEALLTALWIGTILYFGCKEMSTRKERESHNNWIYEIETGLRCIENEYQRKCEEITEIYFKQYLDSLVFGYIEASLITMNQIVDKYRNEIDKAKKDSLNIEEINRVSWGKIKYSTIPDHLKKTHENRISCIEDSFRKLSNHMKDYVTDIERARKQCTTPRIAREEWEEELKKFEKEIYEDWINQYTETKIQ